VLNASPDVPFRDSSPRTFINSSKQLSIHITIIMSAQASEDRTRSQIIESSEAEDSHQDMERQSFINHPQSIPQPRWAKKSRTSVFNKVMAVVNVTLGVILAVSIGLIARELSRSCPDSGAHFVEPYCG
jgi:hypothetical protein